LDIKYTNKEDEKIRTTRSYYSTKEKIDEKKTLTAFSPNLTHFYDSDIIRILHLEPYNIKFASIHDAFIVSSFNCGKLVHSYGSIFKVKIRFKHEIPITCLI
jgi:DNA-directed RNA polymerase